MSVRANFYKAIAGKLNMIVDVNNKPVIKTIDMWNNQWANMGTESPLAFPAVFIEFKTMNWKTIGGKHVQHADVAIALHVGSKVLTKSRYNDAQMNLALQHLELIDIIHKWITGFSGTNFNSFVRISSDHDSDHDEIIAHVETYKCVLEDSTAMPSYTHLEGDKLVIERI